MSVSDKFSSKNLKTAQKGGNRVSDGLGLEWRTRSRIGSQNDMRLETIVLAIGMVSLVAGAAQQNRQSEPKFPLSLFAKATEDDYIGSESCAPCHGEQVKNFKYSGHASYSNNPKLAHGYQGCESCHGPGKFHLDEDNPENIAYSKITPKEINAACMRCHGETMSAGEWHSTAHAQGNVSCTSCHQIHPKPFGEAERPDISGASNPTVVAKPAPKKLLKSEESKLCADCHKSEAAQFRLNSHHPVPEGRLECSDCHAVHPTNKSRKDMKSVKGACVSCHAEKAGPFVYEHDMGTIGDGCAECHRAHGSHNPELLKSFSRGLCAQCHTEKATTHYPGRTCWTAGCHVAMHGSNTDPNFLKR